MAEPVRITQFVVEVVYTTDIDPTGLITAQYVEVIHTTESLTGALLANISSQTIVTANLSISGPIQLFAAFTGAGSLQATLRPDQLAGSLLQLTQTVALEKDSSISTSDTLALTQVIVNGRVRNVSVSSFII